MVRVFKNIQKVINSKLCLQCGACYSICPVNAITINGDIDRQPVVTSECINCGKCLGVCPGMTPLKTDRGDPLLGPVNNCYLGYSSNPDIRFKASSGGIITSLNMFLLQSKAIDGVICIRQSSNSIYKNEAVLITKSEEVITASGSRYSPAYLCCGLKDLPLEEGKNYIIVGKPCDIQAVIKYTEITKKFNFLKIAIFCAQTPAMSATKQILKLNGIDEDNVSSISYRGNGWPGFFTVYSKQYKVLLQKKYIEMWNGFFCKRQYSNKRCFLCHDCTGEFADISVGDAWLKEFTNNSEGHSIIISRSEAGDTLINDCIKNNILIIDLVDPEIAIQSQQNLLTKKNNIFLKRLIASLLNEKIPNEKTNFDIKKNHVKNIPGIAKYYLLKKFNV